MKNDNMKWTMADQSLWDCVTAGLTGLKRLGWLSLSQYEAIIEIMQNSIEEKGA